jgi:hypothetical protein
MLRSSVAPYSMRWFFRFSHLEWLITSLLRCDLQLDLSDGHPPSLLSWHQLHSHKSLLAELVVGFAASACGVTSQQLQYHITRMSNSHLLFILR